MKVPFKFLFSIINLMSLFQESELSEVSSTTMMDNRSNEMKILEDPSPTNDGNSMSIKKDHIAQLGIRMDHVENEVSSLKTENKALLERISRLEIGASCKEIIAKNEQSHLIQKRQSVQSGNNKTSKPRAQHEKCASSANLCTYFYPDFPDEYRKKNSFKKSIQSKDNSSPSTSETISPNKVPSSCKDLQLLGHSLSGFYSVQGVGDSSNKIETIFCQFHLEQSLAYEKRMGFVHLKTADVFFQAKSLKTWSGPKQLLTYLEEQLNVGKSFNIFKGIFTAPVNGIYSFMFSTRQASKSTSMLHIRVNRAAVNSLYGPNDCLYCEITLHSTLKLKAGDEVDTFIEYGYLQLSDTYFVGWLQQEDIPILVATNETTTTLN